MNINTWSNLTFKIETFTSFLIYLSDTNEREISDYHHLNEEYYNIDKYGFGSKLNVIIIPKDVSDELKTISTSYDYETKLSEAQSAIDILINENSHVKYIIDNAKRYGILPYHNDPAHINFLTAIAYLCKSEKIKYIYLFPFPLSFASPRKPTVGFMTYTDAILSSDIIYFLHSVTDIIFNEYVEEFIENTAEYSKSIENKKKKCPSRIYAIGTTTYQNN